MPDPKPLFLAPQARQGDGAGYLNEPIRRNLPEGFDEFELADHAARVREATRPEDEPECIGDAIVDAYGELADFYRSQQHAANVLAMRQVRPQLQAEDRLADAQRRAKHAHRKDLSGEFLALKHMLAHDRKGGGNPSSSTLARLERAEGRLDGLDQAA